MSELPKTGLSIVQFTAFNLYELNFVELMCKKNRFEFEWAFCLVNIKLQQRQYLYLMIMKKAVC